MKFIRNPEVKRASILYGAATLILTAAGYFLFESKTSIFIFLVCIIFGLFHFISTYNRYQQIRKLTADIDKVLHDDSSIRFQDYKEGELSILYDEISKMTTRLREHSASLTKDKTYLSDSIADISHQIRTPMTSIHLILSLLTESSTDKRRMREHIFEINKLLEHIDWLVHALLNISKLETKTAKFRKEKILVSELVRKSYEPLSISMELRDINFETVFEDEQVSFHGDLNWTREAVENVLKNCMEHTPQGGTIKVSVSENAVYTKIIIEDNGSGFDLKDLPHLFERFYKGKNSHTQSMGIGLALSRMIITAQSGTIKAENRKDTGAKFTIKFYKQLTM